MSVQFFKGVGGSSLDMFNGTTGASYSGYAVKWGAKISVPIDTENGARRTQVISGASQGASLVEAINNATDTCQWIVDNSLGVLTMFTLQCGLYRHDKLGTPIPARTLRYGYIDATNKNDANGPVLVTGKVRSVRAFIPFIVTNKSIDTLNAEFQALLTAGKVCSLNFHDEEQDSFDVTPMTGLKNSFEIKGYSRDELALLSSNDDTSGGSDGVLRKRP